MLVDVDMLSSLSQQLLVECLGFAFVAGMEYKRLTPFCSFCKMIGHMLSTCRHCPQSDRSNRQVKYK